MFLDISWHCFQHRHVSRIRRAWSQACARSWGSQIWVARRQLAAMRNFNRIKSPWGYWRHCPLQSPSAMFLICVDEIRATLFAEPFLDVKHFTSQSRKKVLETLLVAPRSARWQVQDLDKDWRRQDHRGDKIPSLSCFAKGRWSGDWTLLEDLESFCWRNPANQFTWRISRFSYLSAGSWDFFINSCAVATTFFCLEMYQLLLSDLKGWRNFYAQWWLPVAQPKDLRAVQFLSWCWSKDFCLTTQGCPFICLSPLFAVSYPRYIPGLVGFRWILGNFSSKWWSIAASAQVPAPED